MNHKPKAAASANDYSILIKDRDYRQQKICSSSADQQSSTPGIVEKTVKCKSKKNETLNHEPALEPRTHSKGIDYVDAIEEEIETDNIEEEKKEQRDRQSPNLNEQADIDHIEQEIRSIEVGIEEAEEAEASRVHETYPIRVNILRRDSSPHQELEDEYEQLMKEY